jgi:hypothetical protein
MFELCIGWHGAGHQERRYERSAKGKTRYPQSDSP